MTDSKDGRVAGTSAVAGGHAKVEFQSRNKHAPEKKHLIKSSLESSKLQEDSSIHGIQPGQIEAGQTTSFGSDHLQINNSTSHKGTKITKNNQKKPEKVAHSKHVDRSSHLRQAEDEEVEGRSPSPHHGSVPDEFISIRRSTEVDHGLHTGDSGHLQHADQREPRQNDGDGQWGQAQVTGEHLVGNSGSRMIGQALIGQQQAVKTESSTVRSRYISAASSMPSGPSVIVDQTTQQSVEFGSIKNITAGIQRDQRHDEEAHGQDDDVKDDKLNKINQEIVNLYLKIKRCSKDVNITESQYLEQVETPEDKEERMLIAKMDPLIVLQYINVSIDVIINLKFEDIENKMAETAVKRMDYDNQKNPDNKSYRTKKQVTKSKPLATDSLVNTSDQEIPDQNDHKMSIENQEIEVANQLEDLVVEDTPQQIRDKVKQIGKPSGKHEEKDNKRDATVIIKKSKTCNQSVVGPEEHVAMDSERVSLSKYSMKSIQPMQSGRAPGTDTHHNADEAASSIDESPSCPRIYEEIIQQLEADIRKHIRIEHQLKLHIESVEDRVEELERDIDKYEKKYGKLPGTSSLTDKDEAEGNDKHNSLDNNKESSSVRGHSKMNSRASEVIEVAKFKAEIEEMKEKLQVQKTEINVLKEDIKAKDKKEVGLQKEIGQQNQSLIQLKEELLAKNEKVQGLEKKVDELGSIKQKNQKLEDYIKQLKKELDGLKREKAEWESEQLVLLQREKMLNKSHHQTHQQDLNQSGLSNLSNYTQTIMGKQLIDRSEGKQKNFTGSTRIPTTLENPNATQQFLVLEKQRFNSLEKLTGLGGSVSSTTGGGHNKGNHQKLQNFIQKQNYQSQPSKSQQQSKSQNTALQLTKIYTGGSINMTGHGQSNQVSKQNAVHQNSHIQFAQLAQSQSALASASSQNLGHSPQRLSKQTSGYGFSGSGIAQQISSRAGMVVSALGAPTSNNISGLQSTLGNGFNGRNSSGLLYMHHGSLNGIAQAAVTGVGGPVNQAGPNAAMIQGQNTLNNQVAAALHNSSVQSKQSQNQQNAIKKMYQTQQHSRQIKGKQSTVEQIIGQTAQDQSTPNEAQKNYSRSLSKPKKNVQQYMPKYIVKNEKGDSRTKNRLELVQEAQSASQQQSLDRGSFKNYTDGNQGNGKAKGNGVGEIAAMKRSQALLARGQLSDGQRTITSLSGTQPGQNHLISDMVQIDGTRYPLNTSKLNDKFNQTQQQAISKFNNFTQHESFTNDPNFQKIKISGQKTGASNNVSGIQQQQQQFATTNSSFAAKNQEYLSQQRNAQPNRNNHGQFSSQDRQAQYMNVANSSGDLRQNNSVNYHNVSAQGDSTGGTKIVNKSSDPSQIYPLSATQQQNLNSITQAQQHHQTSHDIKEPRHKIIGEEHIGSGPHIRDGGLKAHRSSRTKLNNTGSSNAIDHRQGHNHRTSQFRDKRGNSKGSIDPSKGGGGHGKGGNHDNSKTDKHTIGSNHSSAAIQSQMVVIKQKSINAAQSTISPAPHSKLPAQNAQPGSQRIPMIPGSQNQGTLVAKGSYIPRGGAAAGQQR